jgi:hypothetical protein
MKKILLMLFTVGLVLSASAQHGGIRGGHGGVRIVSPRISVIGGYGPYLGYGYGFGYNPFYGYPGYYPGMYRSGRSSKLDLQVEDIKLDYKDRIWSARHDTDLSRKERRVKVHELKHERDDAVINAKRNYYKTGYNS